MTWIDYLDIASKGLLYIAVAVYTIGMALELSLINTRVYDLNKQIRKLRQLFESDYKIKSSQDKFNDQSCKDLKIAEGVIKNEQQTNR